MESESTFLFHALLLGIFITFVYDILRIFRRVIPHGNFLVSLEDIAFWVYCAGEVFLMMYYEGDGTLRWFAVLGAMVGMFAYKKLLSAVFVKYASGVLKKILSLISKATGKAVHRGKRSGIFLKKRLTFFFKILKMNL